MLMTLIFTLFTAQAASLEITTEAEVLAQTGLDAKTLSMMIQKDLESFMYYDDDGISCGLEEFTIEKYIVLEKVDGQLTKFEVETNANGPVGECIGYKDQACFTTVSKKSGTWEAVYTDCDTHLFEE